MGERIIGTLELPKGAKPVSLGRKFQSASNWSKIKAKGCMIEGELLHVFENIKIDPKTKTEKVTYSYVFKALKDGITINSELKDVPYKAGEEILVYGAGQLDKYMKARSLGDKMAITYLGKDTKADGNPHSFGFGLFED